MKRGCGKNVMNSRKGGYVWVEVAPNRLKEANRKCRTERKWKVVKDKEMVWKDYKGVVERRKIKSKLSGWEERGIKTGQIRRDVLVE